MDQSTKVNQEPRQHAHHRRRRPHQRPGRAVAGVARPDAQPGPRPAPPSHAASDPNTLRIIPLAGCEEVGRNMTVVEYGGDIVIIDMGLQFPEEDMPGIDYIIPNITYLRSRASSIRAVVFTHGHLDHIGAVPHLLGELGSPPIIATPLTLALIKKRLQDFKHSPRKLRAHQINSIEEKISLGKFQLEFFSTSHSIMDSIGVLLKTPVGTVVHPGDWKFEDNPKIAEPIVYAKLAERLRGQRTIALLDSTGSTKPGHQLAESQIYETLRRIITEARGRVIMATFSSMLERIRVVLGIAEAVGKKVAFEGFSMKTNVEIAKQLGYLKYKPSTVIDAGQSHRYPPNRVIILCTGAQGESQAALMRIANGEHRYLKVEPNDTILFSSSVIPGNERTIQRLKDILYRQAAEVYHNELMDVHAGGHALAGDTELLLKVLHPEYVVTVHGNHYLLKENAKIARRVGYPDDHVLVPDNGQVISFDRQGGKLTAERTPADYVFVDGLGVGDISHVVLRDRKALADDGMVVIIVAVRRTGQLSGKPEIISRGFVQPKDNPGLLDRMRQKIRELLADVDPKTPPNVNYLKDKLRNEVGQLIYRELERRPMILPVVLEV